MKPEGGTLLAGIVFLALAHGALGLMLAQGWRRGREVGLAGGQLVRRLLPLFLLDGLLAVLFVLWALGAF